MSLKYLVAACGLGLTVGAANATTYNYVGPSFDSTLLTSGYVYDPNLGRNITGSVTFNIDTSALNGQIETTIGPGVGNPDVLNLGLTAGTFAINTSAFGSGSPLHGLFSFTNGQITAWNVYSPWPGPLGNGLQYIQVGGSIVQPASDDVRESATTTLNGQNYDLGARVNANCTSPLNGCVPDAALGTWTEIATTQVATNATPLPAALPLFASGLGAFGLLGWRRKRKALAAA